MTTPHISFVVNNVRVFFPFEPYDTQRDYVESVIKALVNKQNALLESPTGTGKTLSLLCSALAWLQSPLGGKSIIYYTSRTHMQLAQAAKELKRTAYARNPAVVIGSRAQMCLNDEVRHQAGDHLINRACRNAIAKNACSYHSNYEQKLEALDINGVNDIEDLCRFGRSNLCCPFYASKKVAETKASLIFMPYNYLLDASIRKSIQLKFENSVIIFDEAHNIESVLKDSVSGSFTRSCLATIQESCLRLPAKLHEALNQVKHGLTRFGYDPQDKRSQVVDELGRQKNSKHDKEVKVNPIEELAEKLTNDKLQQVNKCADLLREEIPKWLTLDKTAGIQKVQQVMQSAGILYTTSSMIITTLESMASFWSIAGVMSPVLVARYVSSITNLSRVVAILYPEECLSVTRQTNHESELNQCYTTHLRGIYETSRGFETKGRLKDWELNIWCLHAAIGMKKLVDSSSLNGPRSLIITSGTLAPMRPVEEALGIECKIVKELKHVIDDRQLKIMIIENSPNSYSLLSTHEAAKKDAYMDALGRTLLPLLQILPFGTLVFFPSYSQLDRTIAYWRNKSTIWKDISSISAAFIESRAGELFLQDVATFKRKVDCGAGRTRAVFFGVCRGKLSEGINLEGNHCRTVLLTGLPYPNISDPKVDATKKFNEKKGDNNQWYSHQMRRALNQTIGRVIRSRNDFGMLILCSPKFKPLKWGISEWAKKFFPIEAQDINSAESQIKDFFKVHGILITESASESVGAFELSMMNRTNNRAIPSDASRSNSQDSNHNQGSPTPIAASIRDRQAAMIAEYRVDRATYERLISSRARTANQTELNPQAKRPRTTTEIFETICNQDAASSGISLSSTRNLKDDVYPNPVPAQQPTNTVCETLNNVSPETSVNHSQGGYQQGIPSDEDLNEVYIPKPPPKSLNIFKKRGLSRQKPKQTQSTIRLVE